MKRILITLLTIGFATSIYAQHAGADALFLRSKYDPEANNKILLTREIKELLKVYYPNKDLNAIDEAFLNGQPFLNGIFKNLTASSDNSHYKGFLSSLGNLNVTNFADGLAKFLVQRSKEELNIAFFRRFQDFVRNHPEVSIALPATSAIISQLAAYNYPAMLPALRSSFYKDLNALSRNLINLRETSSYDGYNTNRDVTQRADKISQYLNQSLSGRSLIAGLMIAEDIVKGTNLAEIISSVANDKLAAPNDNFSNSIRFVDFLSQSFRSTDKDRIWISEEQLTDLFKDSTTLKLLFGLLYATNQASIRPLEFSFTNNHFSLQTFLAQLDEQWSSQASARFVQHLKNVAIVASQVADNVKQIIDSKTEDKQDQLSSYADYISTVSNFLNTSLTLLFNDGLLSSSSGTLQQDIQKLSSIITTVVNCCYDIKSHNYGALVIQTSSLISMIPGCEKTLGDEFVKYGVFMANVIVANNSDDVKAAIDAAVLPVGSSSIKRETKTNISLNAFIGPFGSMEYLPALTRNKTAFAAGITAPVGIAFSWGKLGKSPLPEENKNNKIRGGKSITLFIPLIDVGSLASYRIANDSSKVASEVTLSNIMSPGVYFYYGLGKCPISIGIGGQVGPQLRKITATLVNKDKNFYIRFGISIVVDIPLLNFYTRN